MTISAFIEQTVATVAQHRLPAIYSERVFVTSGGLVYYGADRFQLYRGVASYVDRILRGEKAGDLPYQLPTKYDLVINLQTARALGLTIPPMLLFTADVLAEPCGPHSRPESLIDALHRLAFAFVARLL